MGVFDSLDSGLTELLGQWNIYSTGLVTLLLALVSYRVIATREPDVHPMLLARQATPSSVRNEGESPVYRSQAAPHGMPLNAGLNVKDSGASKWSRGRNGDLRDVWRKAATGGEEGATGRLLTVLGSQNVVDHKLGTRSASSVGGLDIANLTKRTSPDRSTSSDSTLRKQAALELLFTCQTRLSSW